MQKQKVTDTHPEIQRRVDELLAAKTPEERVLIGVSMFQASKLMIRERLKRENPNLIEKNLQKKLIEELYGRIGASHTGLDKI